MIFFGFIIMGAVCLIVFVVFVILCIRIKMSWTSPTKTTKLSKEAIGESDIEKQKHDENFERTNDRPFFNNPSSMIDSGFNSNIEAMDNKNEKHKEFNFKEIVKRYNEKIEQHEVNRNIIKN